MEGPTVPMTGVGPVCPCLLSPLRTPLGLASLRAELSAVGKPAMLSSVQSARVPSGTSCFVLLKLTTNESSLCLLDILSFTRPVTERGPIIIAPRHTEVKGGPERLGNLPGNAQRHSLSVPFCLFLGRTFPFWRLGLFGEVVGSLPRLLREPPNVSKALGGPPVLPEALLEERGPGCGIGFPGQGLGVPGSRMEVGRRPPRVGQEEGAGREWHGALGPGSAWGSLELQEDRNGAGVLVLRCPSVSLQFFRQERACQGVRTLFPDERGQLLVEGALAWESGDPGHSCCPTARMLCDLMGVTASLWVSHSHLPNQGVGPGLRPPAYSWWFARGFEVVSGGTF